MFWCEWERYAILHLQHSKLTIIVTVEITNWKIYKRYVYTNNHCGDSIHGFLKMYSLIGSTIQWPRRDIANNFLFYINIFMCSSINVVLFKSTFYCCFMNLDSISVYILRHVISTINNWSDLTLLSIAPSLIYYLVDNP